MDVVTKECALIGLLGEVNTVNTTSGQVHLHGELQANKLDGAKISIKPLHWRVEPGWTQFEVDWFEPWTVVHIGGLLHT